MIQDKALCPVCFKEYGVSRLRRERPTCPECDSEAMEIDLVSKRKFLAKISLAEIQGLRDSWAKDTRFLPAYHSEKLARIEALCKAKKQLSASPRKAVVKKAR